jgi:hypothetical protein
MSAGIPPLLVRDGLCASRGRGRGWGFRQSKWSPRSKGIEQEPTLCSVVPLCRCGYSGIRPVHLPFTIYHLLKTGLPIDGAPA